MIAFRTVADYRRLRGLAGPGVPAVVVGGGFIGSELAAALAGAGCRVTICFPEPGIGARLFPSELAAAVDGLYREHGVEVRSGELVERVDRGPDGLEVVLAGGRRLTAAIVVAGLGIEPETELAARAGLTVADGIVVDARGAADEEGEVFAAGDVARFPARLLGRRMRVEHEDHANSHGFAVGANMAGAGVPYDHLPFFYSDLFELGYEAVGELDARLDTVAEWAEPLRRGVVAYLDPRRHAGPGASCSGTLFGRVPAIREAIAAGEPLSAGTLVGLIG